MPLGMEVGIGPGDCIRWGPRSARKRGHPPPPPIFCLCLLWKTAGSIKMPLGTEVNLGLGDVVLNGVAAHPKRVTAPSFWFMSIVVKRLDGWRRHLVRKYTSTQATLY